MDIEIFSFDNIFAHKPNKQDAKPKNKDNPHTIKSKIQAIV
jgi:hypothetical protein